jgi:uncharacterized small protein (DUF1192 family)
MCKTIDEAALKIRVLEQVNKDLVIDVQNMTEDIAKLKEELERLYKSQCPSCKQKYLNHQE